MCKIKFATKRCSSAGSRLSFEKSSFRTLSFFVVRPVCVLALQGFARFQGDRGREKQRKSTNTIGRLEQKINLNFKDFKSFFFHKPAKMK